MYIKFKTMIVVIWLTFRPAVAFLFQAVLVLLNKNISASGFSVRSREYLLVISE